MEDRRVKVGWKGAEKGRGRGGGEGRRERREEGKVEWVEFFLGFTWCTQTDRQNKSEHSISASFTPFT